MPIVDVTTFPMMGFNCVEEETLVDLHNVIAYTGLQTHVHTYMHTSVGLRVRRSGRGMLPLRDGTPLPHL